MTASILRLWGRWPVRAVDSFMRAADLAMTWRTRAWQRHALASFDDRMLKDIGLSRSELEREADKPPWRP